MRALLLATLAGLSLLSSGCCTPRKPASLTLDDAFKQVAAGLNAFSAMPLDRRSGLMPDQVTVVLNVTEEHTRSADVGATATPADRVPKLTVDFSRQESETHGNTITLKFQNILLADKSTLAGAKSPEELQALIGALTNAGFVVKLPAPRP